MELRSVKDRRMMMEKFVVNREGTLSTTTATTAVLSGTAITLFLLGTFHYRKLFARLLHGTFLGYAFISETILRKSKSSTSTAGGDKLDNENDSDLPERTLGPPLDDSRYGGLLFTGDTDELYDEGGPKPFAFNEDVAKVFDDMVSRSVPLYREVNDFLLYWVHRYYREGTVIVDLGCSTGTTLDLICRSFEADSSTRLKLVGIDNSKAMVEKCKEKLKWANNKHSIDIFEASISDFKLMNSRASFVIVNYTLQFLPIREREAILSKIHKWLIPNGVLFVSEKLRNIDPELQETTTSIYEDFKMRRGYSKHYIAQKKEALMNVLVPYTENGLKAVLKSAGFDQINLAVKWNNFATFTAKKLVGNRTESSSKSRKKAIGKGRKVERSYKFIDELFDYQPDYFSSEIEIEEPNLFKLVQYRQEMFRQKGNLGENNLAKLDEIARKILKLNDYLEIDTSLGVNRLETIDLNSDSGEAAAFEDDVHLLGTKQLGMSESKGSESSAHDLTEDGVIVLCERHDLKDFPRKDSSSGYRFVYELVNDLIPWKKGPVKICDVLIDAEWRSDLKWTRISPWLPSLAGKTVCDIGCNNGYFMFQMLTSGNNVSQSLNEAETTPKLVIGIEPSLNCLLQFEFMKRLSRSKYKNRLKFEFGKADMLEFMPRCFDVVFCLGVLYHTSDPIKMLRDIHASLVPNGYLVVDCQGIDLSKSEDNLSSLPLCLFPRKRYANMKGVYFLPTIEALKNWLKKASFTDIRVIFNEKLSPKEQRITPFAPVNTSLKESLDPNDANKTIEGYPAPYRFYIRAKRG